MPYYHTRPLCGTALDPGERCDCTQVQCSPDSSEPEAKQLCTDATTGDA